MKRFTTAIASVAASAIAGTANAEGNLSRLNVQRVEIEMGTNDDGTMFFSPNHFDFETGQAYAWIMTNTDDIIHEVSIHDMRERIFTRKLEIGDADGNLVAEIKGDINEVEIGPHQTVEWFFVAVQTAEGIEISCEVPGHAEAGMVGTVTLH